MGVAEGSWAGTAARRPPEKRRQTLGGGGSPPAPTWRVVCERRLAPDVLARAGVAAGQQACSSTGQGGSEPCSSAASPRPRPTAAPTCCQQHTQPDPHGRGKPSGEGRRVGQRLPQQGSVALLGDLSRLQELCCRRSAGKCGEQARKCA